MSLPLRVLVLLAVSLTVMCAAVFVVAQQQRSAAQESFGQSRSAERMLTAMLDQETGMRGYQATGVQELLEPFQRGRETFEAQAALASQQTADDPEPVRAALRRQTAIGRAWQRQADTRVATALRGSRTPRRREYMQSTRMMDRFRAANAAYQRQITLDRDAHLERAARSQVLIIVAVAVLFVGLGYLLVARAAQAQMRRDERQARRELGHRQFVDVLQVTRSEGEAQDLVRRHIERTLPGSRAVVLNRNNSADRLEPATDPAVIDGLPAALDGARPDSCLAVRMARTHASGASEELNPLLSCDLCGKLAGELTCAPSLVGGEVIGSVLVTHPAAPRAAERDQISEAVAQAAPVLANLRNLAIAETRAATDGLTGLSNVRALQDTIKRLAATAVRTGAPLSAIMLDLDHFKQINDTYGHEKGNDVLAAVGDTLTAVMRPEDFVSRSGGEEFVVLLPDTSLDGAEQAAERLRAAISRLDIPGVDRPVTASMGVAVLPDHAAEPEELLRQADRALYQAKHNGRDRVEVAQSRPAGG